MIWLIFLALSWGASNRGRGWGPPINCPAWQLTAAKFLSRDTMAAWHGISIILACLAAGVPLWWHGIALACSTAILWRVAVSPGWGEYQDGRVATNHEIGWIDWLVLTKIISRLPARFARVHWIDGISMGFRGAYYLPIFIAAGIIMHSWWFALPAAFFWQAGAIYGFMWHRKVKGDYVFWCEWIDDTIRGALFFTAFAGSLGLVG